MHSLKQGNFFTTKKNGYQYLEKKSTSSLIEGFKEGIASNNTNWKYLKDTRINHVGQVGPEFKYNDSNTDVSHNITGYANITNTQEKEELHDKLINAAASVSEIYAFEITSEGNITYYQKVNNEFPDPNNKPAPASQNGTELFLKPDSGIAAAIPDTINPDDAIMNQIQGGETKNFNILMTWYNAVLADYDETLKNYYIARENAAKSGSKGSTYKNKIIQWDDAGTKKYAWVNNVGVYRILKMDNGAIVGTDGSVGDGVKRQKSLCPVSVTQVNQPPSDPSLKLSGPGHEYTKWEGACYNPGLYRNKDDPGAEVFIDHEGKIHANDNYSKDSTKCGEYTPINIESNYFSNLPAANGNITNYNCDFSVSNNNDQEIKTLESRLRTLNTELQQIAKQDSKFTLSSETQTVLENANLEKIQPQNSQESASYDGADQGLLPILQSLPANEGIDDAGYRKLQHALKNEISVKIPRMSSGELNNIDISGILVTQNELNIGKKQLSNLGNSIASLESSMISKQEQIRAMNLHFLAWGLAGITIGAIGLHTFLKK